MSQATAIDNSDSFDEFGSLPDTVDFIARFKNATEGGEESCCDDSSDGNRSDALL
jgi:hypothetical protein